jgi:hypothetical protein
VKFRSVARFQRDALGQPGVRTNDAGYRAIAAAIKLNEL